MRIRFAHILSVPLAGLCLVACTSEQTLVSATEVIVRVVPSVAVRTQSHAIRVRIASSDGNTWNEEKPTVYSLGEPPQPLDLVVVLRRGSSAALFELVIEAIDNSTPAAVLAQERRLARFEPARALLLEVPLSECGGRELGFVCEKDPGCHGASCLSCVDARCAPTPRVSDLPEWDGTVGTTVDARDAAMHRRDAGPLTPTDDTAMKEDAGSTDLAENTQQTPTPTKTEAGTVMVRPEAGTVLVQTDGGSHDTTKPPCVAAEEVCDTLDNDCDGKTDEGVSAGKTATCQDIDECAPGNPCLNGGRCVNGDNAYRCDCPPAYRGTRCETDIDDCAGNTCAPGACVDGVGTYSCTCGSGFVEVEHTCQPQFRNNGDGTVFDATTKIVWQRAVPTNPAGCVNPPTCTWSEAKSYCAGLSLAGSGWRLPTKEEFTSIMDSSRGIPPIDPVAFPATPASNFWASDNYYATNPEAEGSREQAWTTDFSGRASGYIGAGNHFYVRCARK